MCYSMNKYFRNNIIRLNISDKIIKDKLPRNIELILHSLCFSKLETIPMKTLKLLITNSAEVSFINEATMKTLKNESNLNFGKRNEKPILYFEF